MSISFSDVGENLRRIVITGRLDIPGTDSIAAKFEALAKRGKAIPNFKAPEGVDKKQAEQEYQKGELERSIKYLRETLGLGLKS